MWRKKATDSPQEPQIEVNSSKLPDVLKNTIHNKPQLIWMATSMILMLLLIGSLSGKVSKEDYDSLKSDYGTLQSKYESLEEEYDSLQSVYDTTVSDFESTQTSLDETRSAYEEYQERMLPFDSLTDDELNTVASRITQTLEEKQAEEAAKAQAAAQAQAEAEALAAQQQTQESTVWIPRTGSKYHSNASCSNMKNPSQVTISQAQASGYEPCKKCY